MENGNKIPKMYETEGTPLEKKTIHMKYDIKEIGFYWLVAELDPKDHIAFGYANLNDDQNAEWGNIGLDEVMQSGGQRDREWIPVTYREAMKRIREEGRRQ